MLRKTFASLANAGAAYELRMMRVKPGRYADFNKLAALSLPHRPAEGKLLGYWTAQLGGLNEFVQVWQYDSLSHRYECRKRLESDAEWERTFLLPSRSMLDTQWNELMRIVYLEGSASTQSYKYLLQFSTQKDVELSGPSAVLAATFQISIGPNEGKYLHVVKGKKLEDLEPTKPTVGCSSAIVGPARWSTTMGALWR